MSAPRVRFAPSPTGDLHLGNARTALFNWLFARSRRGVFILRIEDTDASRSRPEYEARLIEDLRWLGLGWDEGIEEGGDHGPYRQSERSAEHHRRAEQLIQRGLAYPCFCPIEVLEKERVAQREAGSVPLYSGRCRAITPAEGAARRNAEPAAVRFNIQAAAGEDSAVGFIDLVHGPIRFPISQIGDFVIVRRDGGVAYNFAVVVDDLMMKITHVIRGDDHLSNTPRQVLIRKALGAGVGPEYAHLPLITGPGGSPLSKREGAVSVVWFRERGYPPEALINSLALLGWSAPGGQELLTREELVESFDLGRVSNSPASFDPQKLDALAARHMTRLPQNGLTGLAVEQLRRAGRFGEVLLPEEWEWVGRLARLYAERLPNMERLVEESSLLFDFDPGRSLQDEDVRATFNDPKTRAVVESLSAKLGDEPLSAPRFQAIADEVRRETGAKGRGLFHPLRVALTGAGSGPDLVKLLPVIEEGHALRLSRPIPSCGERVRGLLGAVGGERG